MFPKKKNIQSLLNQPSFPNLSNTNTTILYLSTCIGWIYLQGSDTLLLSPLGCLQKSSSYCPSTRKRKKNAALHQEQTPLFPLSLKIT